MDAGPLPFCRVVVDVPTRALSEPFDYAVPAGLDAAAVVGAPVVVPLGPRKHSGWVVERTAAPSCDPGKVKLLADVTGAPMFDETAARLALMIADRYLAPPSEALRLVLPPGQARRLERYVRAVEGAEEGGGRTRAAPAAADAELLSWLAAREEAELAEIDELFGKAGREAVRRLVKAGLVAEDARLDAPRIGARTEEWAELALRADEALERVGGRAAKQRALVEALVKGPSRTADVLETVGAGRPVLLALVGKGLVSLERRAVERPVDTRWFGAEEPRPDLEPEQQVALDLMTAALQAPGRVFVLEGVTGSGKTEVYLRLIEEALCRGRGAIVLVPEISLTAQTVGRFSNRFGDSVAVLHSRLSPGERFDQWRSVAEGRRTLVVGARSALFAPVRPLGVIVLDEEHDGSFKQESSPRYHAREVAIELGRLTGAVVVLGSATPSLEAFGHVETGSAARVHLSRRVAGRSLPEIAIVDMGCEFKSGNRSILSGALRAELQSCLDAGQKAIILINRRGYAGFMLCRDCGHVPKCPSCDVSLTVHSGDRLRCHHCGHRAQAPRECPACSSPFLRTFGLGTQRVEEVLSAEFDGVPIVRMDADTTRGKRGHDTALERFAAADAGVLLGTQMVAKGHDFPEVSLVGVIAADLALHLPDLRAAERTYQLLHQVAGRAGRGDLPGRVVVQTYCPEHYAIAALPSWRLDDFYRRELAYRRELGYPPYGALVNLVVSGKDPRAVEDAAKTMHEHLEGGTARADPPEWTDGSADPPEWTDGPADPPGWADGPVGASGPSPAIELLGPCPAPLSRLAGHHRRHLLVKGSDGAALRAWLGPRLRSLRVRLSKTVSLAVDVDPLWLM